MKAKYIESLKEQNFQVAIDEGIKEEFTKFIANFPKYEFSGGHEESTTLYKKVCDNVCKRLQLSYDTDNRKINEQFRKFYKYEGTLQKFLQVRVSFLIVHYGISKGMSTTVYSKKLGYEDPSEYQHQHRDPVKKAKSFEDYEQLKLLELVEGTKSYDTPTLSDYLEEMKLNYYPKLLKHLKETECDYSELQDYFQIKLRLLKLFSKYSQDIDADYKRFVRFIDNCAYFEHKNIISIGGPKNG